MITKAKHLIRAARSHFPDSPILQRRWVRVRLENPTLTMRPLIARISPNAKGKRSWI